MTFALVGSGLALAGFLVAGVAVALAVAFLTGRLRAARSGTLLALRLLPTAAGLAFALGLVLPGYLRYEPRGHEERVGLLVPLLAAAALALLGLALVRAVRTGLATRALGRAWVEGARPLALPGLGLPAYEIEHAFPVVAVVGLLRPRLFVARQVLERLTPRELAAVLEHERAHVTAHDNLRALLMGCAPDVLGLSAAGARLGRAFDAAAEREADDRAASGATGPVELAAALVKVARLAPPGARLDLPLLAFHDGDELVPRVTRLLAREPGSPEERPAPRRWALPAALVLLALAAGVYSPVARLVHEGAEITLQLLSF